MFFSYGNTGNITYKAIAQVIFYILLWKNDRSGLKERRKISYMQNVAALSFVHSISVLRMLFF